MKNLAGSCMSVVADRHVRLELETAGVNVVEHDEVRTGEVQTSVTGELGTFTLWRAWRYWCVVGLVHIDVAEKLDAMRSVVRATGHCLPSEPLRHARRMINGADVADASERDGFERLGMDPDNPKYNIHWTDDPESVGDLFVDGYHIDTQEGLNFFVSTVKKDGLA